LAGADVSVSAKSNADAGKVEKLLTPSHDEVLAAVASLHDDELKPFGRILRKRISELAVNATLDNDDNLPDVDIKHVQAVCEGSDRMKVQPEEGGDWSVAIVDRSQSFIDIYSPCDDYSETLWDAMSAYFDAPEQKDMVLPGGRYSCARTLLARPLLFLSGYSMGKVCHIVQLAMTQRKILGYKNGSVVPYARSQSKLKEECAMCSQPCKPAALEDTASNSITTMPIATWEITRQHLQEILDSAPEPAEGNRTVPLSNVKRLFRSKFHTELSETMLGHSKLSELLQDAKLSDICTVQLGAHGYVVMQVSNGSSEAKCDKIDSMSFTCDQTDSTKSIASSPPSTGFSPCDPLKIELDDCHVGLAAELLEFHDDFYDDFNDGPSGWSMGRSPDFFGEDEPPSRLKFCLNEPLEGIEETGLYQHADAPMRSSRCSLRSPDLGESCIGSIALSRVKNTFIHSPLLPPTPLRNAASRRAHSLPRNVGSDNDAWEATFQALGCRQDVRRRNIPCAEEREVQYEFDSNNCTTPSVYNGYHGVARVPPPSGYPCMSRVPPSPGYNGRSCVPPSPALTASPMCFRTYSPYARNSFYPAASAPLPPLPCSYEFLQQSGDPPMSPSSKVIYLSSLLA
jgi:hypothetical protein